MDCIQEQCDKENLQDDTYIDLIDALHGDGKQVNFEALGTCLKKINTKATSFPSKR